MYEKFDLPQATFGRPGYQPMLPGLEEDPDDVVTHVSSGQDHAGALFARNAWYWVALVMAVVQAATFVLLVVQAQ